MQVLTLSPGAITVKGGLARFRTDLGEVMKLADSIVQHGQLQPIVINRHNDLICGGRRLAACMLAGINVTAIYQDTIDPLKMRELELEENIQRKDFTPAEEVLAVAEIHKLKQEIHGVSCSGKEGGWTLTDTAESIGKTKGNVIEALHLAEMVAMFPELKGAKTKKEIKSTAKAMEKISSTITGLKKYEESSKTQSNYTLFHQDAKDFLSQQPERKYDVFLTDPPYGISIHETMMGLGGHTGQQNSSGITFDDSKEEMELGIDYLAKELFRITTSTAQGYIFVAPEHFYPIRDKFLAVGWCAYVKPMIWIKNASGQANQPSMYPGSCYETILFLRKPDARLVAEGRPDWIQCQPIIGGAKQHPNEKPIPLLTELLDRIALPGMTCIDPFIGSGSSIEAAVKKKLFATGCDKLLECYATALKRLEGVK